MLANQCLFNIQELNYNNFFVHETAETTSAGIYTHGPGKATDLPVRKMAARGQSRPHPVFLPMTKMAAGASPLLSPSASLLFPKGGARGGLTGSSGAPAGPALLAGGRRKARPLRRAGQWARGPAPAASADGAMSVDRSRPGRGAGVRGPGRAAPRGRRTPGPRRPPPPRSWEGSGRTEAAPAGSPGSGRGAALRGGGAGKGLGWLRGAEREGGFGGAAQKGAAGPGEPRGCEGAAGQRRAGPGTGGGRERCAAPGAVC